MCGFSTIGTGKGSSTRLTMARTSAVSDKADRRSAKRQPEAIGKELLNQPAATGARVRPAPRAHDA